MNVGVVYVYDASRRDLRGRREQLEDQLTASGLIEAWAIRETPSRNQLLLSVAADKTGLPSQTSVSLIDLRVETGDLEQRGFKICETIVRHPTLSAATRPLIWADEHTAANLRGAERVGAVAIIDDAWVDSGDGQPLAEVLEWASRYPASPARAVGGVTHAFSPDHSSLVQEARERDGQFERWFGFPPRRLHYALLWGMADAVELKFLLGYVTEAGYAVTERAARRELERLQVAMSPQVEALERPEPARAEIARRFLAEMSPPEPSPLPDLSWPSLGHVRELLFSRTDVVSWAYLAPGAEQLLHRFFVTLALPEKATVAQRHKGIREAIVRVADAIGQPESSVHELARTSAHAISDAFNDWRDHGPPEPLQ